MTLGATPEEVAPEPSSATATNGSTPPAPRWQDGLNADLRQNETLSRYKSLDELGKAHLEARAKLSEKGLVLPKPDAKPEAWDEVYTALGRPEAPDKYDLGDWKAPEIQGWEEGIQKEALAVMHQAGLSNAQAKAVLSWYGDKLGAAQGAISEQQAQVVKQWGEQVGRKWGQASEAKLDLANRTFETYFPPDVRDAIAGAVTRDGGPLAEHPAFLEAMASIGDHLAEHQLLGDKEPRQHAKTPEEASHELTSLQNDPAFRAAFADPRHPGFREAHERHDRLLRQTMANPDGDAGRTVFVR